MVLLPLEIYASMGHTLAAALGRGMVHRPTMLESMQRQAQQAESEIARRQRQLMAIEPQLESFIDYLIAHPRSMGFDRVVLYHGDYGRETHLRVTAFGVTRVIHCHLLHTIEPHQFRRFMRQTYEELREEALNGLRNESRQRVNHPAEAGPEYTCLATTVFQPDPVCASVAYIGDGAHPRNYPSRYTEEQIKKHRKAEQKAVLLLQNMIGSEQCDVYRKTYRVVTKPSKWFWIIGDIFPTRQHEIKTQPFIGKPNVVRIDNADKLHYTSFCVDQKSGAGPTPYTDKVIAFTMHLIKDEKAFYGLANRIKEDTLNKMPECAFVEL